jgi:hypothetical protein
MNFSLFFTKSDNLEFLKTSNYRLKQLKKSGSPSPSLSVSSDSYLNRMCSTGVKFVTMNARIRYSVSLSYIDCIHVRISEPVDGRSKETRFSFYMMNNVA